jgi:hypothetical protein
MCPDHEALAETVSDRGLLYHFHEDIHKHADIFATCLHRLLTHYKDDGIKNLSNLAKTYTNRFYSWDKRIHEWQSVCDEVLNVKAS